MTDTAFKRTFRAVLIMAAAAVFAQGCETIGRKFVRKPKEKPKSLDSMVLRPEVYAPRDLSPEERYQVYYTYWKSWHDEFLEQLEAGANRKKRASSLKEARSNLVEMKELIDGPKAEMLEAFIARLTAIGEELQKDIYSTNVPALRVSAEKLKREIERDFSFRAVKDELVEKRDDS